MRTQTDDTIDDFDPSAQPGATPFGVPIGAIPMGTLDEVAGKDQAAPILRKLEATEKSQVDALRLLGRVGLAGRR